MNTTPDIEKLEADVENGYVQLALAIHNMKKADPALALDHLSTIVSLFREDFLLTKLKTDKVD